jgi:four helix bundle protein
MSNIAEGFERDGAGEFVQFLSIAKGSVGEVESHLYVALDEAYIAKAEFDAIKALTVSTKKLIAGFMRYLKRSGHRGQKFKK